MVELTIRGTIDDTQRLQLFLEYGDKGRIYLRGRHPDGNCISILRINPNGTFTRCTYVSTICGLALDHNDSIIEDKL